MLNIVIIDFQSKITADEFLLSKMLVPLAMLLWPFCCITMTFITLLFIFIQFVLFLLDINLYIPKVNFFTSITIENVFHRNMTFYTK